MKHPASTNPLPSTGASCGLKPDPEALEDDVGFDFSAARQLEPEPATKNKLSVNAAYTGINQDMP